jgi:hypothetical protein
MVVQPDECVIMTGSRYNLCGYPMPYFIPFVREELGFDIDFTHTRPLTKAPYVSPVNRNKGFLAGLAAALRDDQVSVDDRERLIHSTARPPPMRCHGCSMATCPAPPTWWCGRSPRTTASPW